MHASRVFLTPLLSDVKSVDFVGLFAVFGESDFYVLVCRMAYFCVAEFIASFLWQPVYFYVVCFGNFSSCYGSLFMLCAMVAIVFCCFYGCFGKLFFHQLG